MAADRLETIVSLAKRRGFVYPSSEIYGGLRAAWDYGPLGVELKNNVKRQWWRSMVQGREDVVGLDSCVILAKEVWEASGYKVYGLAPTGRAAQNLEEIGLSSQTLHKFLKDYSDGRSRYHESSVLVLDEAGMVDVKRFNELLTARGSSGRQAGNIRRWRPVPTH